MNTIKNLIGLFLGISSVIILNLYWFIKPIFRWARRNLWISSFCILLGSAFMLPVPVEKQYHYKQFKQYGVIGNDKLSISHARHGMTAEEFTRIRNEQCSLTDNEKDEI